VSSCWKRVVCLLNKIVLLLTWNCPNLKSFGQIKSLARGNSLGWNTFSVYSWWQSEWSIKSKRDVGCTYLTKLKQRNPSASAPPQASCPLTNTHGQLWVNGWPCLVWKGIPVSTPAVRGLMPPVRSLTWTASSTSVSQQPDSFLLIHSTMHQQKTVWKSTPECRVLISFVLFLKKYVLIFPHLSSDWMILSSFQLSHVLLLKKSGPLIE
jgi:hypothetical protein